MIDVRRGSKDASGKLFLIHNRTIVFASVTVVEKCKQETEFCCKSKHLSKLIVATAFHKSVK